MKKIYWKGYGNKGTHHGKNGSYEMKTYILTGATSFIGLAIIRALANVDARIVALSRPNSTRKKFLLNAGITVVESELSTLQCVDLSKEIGRADVFIHIGWNSDFENSRYNLEGQIKNVDFTLDAIYLAHMCKCGTFVGIGSQAECGVLNTPISELTPENPLNAYAEAKCICYEKGFKLAKELGMKFCWPRLLSAYGPYDRSTTMIASCVEAALKKQKMQFTGCEQFWDYIYVDDVAGALLAIAQKGYEGVRYPISSGKGRLLKEYIEIIANETNFPELIDGVGKRAYVEGQPMYLLGNITRLIEDTGFIPNIEFEMGIQKYIAMMRYCN